MPHEARLAVLFADVSGSTQLYDTLGDARARSIVARCVAIMTEMTQRHRGTVIKTIGDEVMSTFPDAAAAAEAAMDMQEAITGQMVVDGRPLAIRIGFHIGPTLREDDDVFGDAVNLAARLVGQAKAGQVLTSGEAYSELPARLRQLCRLIDRAAVRGRREEVAFHELVWQVEGVTLMNAPWATAPSASRHLLLSAGGTELELGEGHPSLTLGRAEQNDIVVQQPVTSRLHARIDYRNGRFMLTDLSANGTFVQPWRGDGRFVHRDSCELAGSGQLGLGEPVAPGSPATVQYSII